MNDPAQLPRARTGWVNGLTRAVDLLCFLMLIATMVTVIYGFLIRALWADGYYVAVALAILGSLIMLIGIAQQAIAARDAATWRDMAEWQIRAAEAKLAAIPTAPGEERIDRDSPIYYEMLIGTLVDHSSRESAIVQAVEKNGH